MKQNSHVVRMEFGNIWRTLNMDLSFDAAIQFLKIYTTDIPSKNDKYVNLLIITLFVSTKERKSPVFINRGMFKLWYIHIKY